jgi:Ulp1 family protease
MVPKDEEGRSEYFFERCSILSSDFFPHTLVFARGIPLEKRMDYLDSMISHPHQGVYYAIIQYLQREYEQYYPGGFWSDFGWKFRQLAVRKQVNTIDCSVYVCMNFYFIAYQLSLQVDCLYVQLRVHTCSRIQLQTRTNLFSYHRFKS